MLIIIQLNYNLSACKLNSPKASYKVATSKEKKNEHRENTKIWQFVSLE
jgi:hypothetical protein